MNLKRTRYAVSSPLEYRDDADGRWRVVYATRTARLVALPADSLYFAATDDLSDLSDGDRQDLIDAELLVVGDELSTIVERQRDANRALGKRTLTVLPTSYCNMGCSYCGQLHRRGGLPDGHRDRLVERIAGVVAAPQTQSLHITWFGGEPLAGYPVIRDVSRRAMELCEKAGHTYSASIVTNGSMLTLEKAHELHRDLLVKSVEITIDGPEEIHDKHRPLKNGKGSYRHITTVIREIATTEALANLNITIRTNVDVNNVEWVPRYIDEMVDLGMSASNINFNIVPVYPWGNDVSSMEIDREEFSRLQLDWYQRMLDQDLAVALLPDKTVEVTCSATTRANEVISSSGKVFSCTEHPLVPQYEEGVFLGAIGSYKDVRPVGQFDDWSDRISRGEVPCAKCPVLPVCGGSCPKQWQEGEVPCPPFKFNFAARLERIARDNGLAPVSHDG